MNFVIDDVLDGGVNGSLNLDTHGKALAFLLLECRRIHALAPEENAMKHPFARRVAAPSHAGAARAGLSRQAGHVRGPVRGGKRHRPARPRARAVR
jgi:hypothetical protein